MDKLTKHRHIWKNKKILRIIYTEWYRKILEDINKDGITVELGSGSGNFKEFKPEIISSDIEYSEWLDICFNAHNMPFKSNSISNIIMIDVLHHLSNPVGFLKDASLSLKKEGKIAIIEPYPSLFSLIIYRLFHPEPFLMNIDYFSKIEEGDKKDPWEANQAISYLLFFKHRKKLLTLLEKDFTLIKCERMSSILYPASGGFEHKSMIPDCLIPLFHFFESLLSPFLLLFAFRCYIVLKKK